MNSQTIHASDMGDALRLVKERLGPDAYILDCSTRKVKEADSLLPRQEVILTASRQAPESVACNSAYSRKPLPEHQRVSDELLRLENLLQALEEQELKLQSPEKRAYPLESYLREFGLWEKSIRHYAQDFEAEAPAVNLGNRNAAIERLGDLVRIPQKIDPDKLRGIHLLLGNPGVGKNSLARKVAWQVAQTGSRVAVIAYGNREDAELSSLSECGREGNFDTAFAPDPESLLSALAHLSEMSLCLVIMPSLEPAQWDLVRSLERGLGDAVLHVHLLVAADGGWRGLEDAVSRADFLSLTRSDRDEVLRPVLDLLPYGDFRLGLISSGTGEDSGLSLADPSTLFRAMKRALEAGAGESDR
ncbi:MAG: hypothetical protein QF492_04785 [Candidatus Krumholzibacteria bacterium]|nr:hypothetical protein [Candidatus Krumholzibacteria bacterium]